MMDIFNLSGNKNSKNFPDGKLGAELGEKNKAIESLNRTGKLVEKVHREKESYLMKKEKILSQKAVLLVKIESELREKEKKLREEKKKLELEFLRIKDKLNKSVESDKSLGISVRAKQKELEMLGKSASEMSREIGRMLHEKLHKEATIMISIAHSHLRMRSFNDVKRAYDSLREIYSKLSPEGKKRIHADIIRLREDIMKGFGG